jgi:dihydrolipoamide dehydrogenase
MGLEVTLIDSSPLLGGACLHRGCIPSKSLLHAARLLSDARNASAFGLRFEEPTVDLDALREWMLSVTTGLAGGIAQMAKRLRVKVVQAEAAFASPTELRLIPSDLESPRIHAFETLLLAAGSSPLPPPDFSTKMPHIWNSTDALAIAEIPASLLVVGGGHIGLELGTVYAALGSRVTLVEMTNGLLPGADRDLVAQMAKRLRTVFEAIHLHTKVADLSIEGDGLRAVLQDIRNGETQTKLFSKALVAIGRRPATERLRLDKAGIGLTDRGFVASDADGRTANPTVFAAGDIAGNPMLAHKAIHEAKAFAARFLGQGSRGLSPYIPAVAFTDPEVAWCGLTEAEAKAKAIPYTTAKCHWAANGRSPTLGRTDGLTKILSDPETGALLGVGITGNGASELIAEAALALETKTSLQDLTHTIHPHPTLSETLLDAAETALANRRRAKGK